MHRSEPDGSLRRRRVGAEVRRSLPEQRGRGCRRLLRSLALLCPGRTSSWFAFHSSFGIGLQSSPRTDSSKVKELSKLFVHAFIVKGSKSQRMKQHKLMSVKWCAGRRGKKRGRAEILEWGNQHSHWKVNLKTRQVCALSTRELLWTNRDLGFWIFSVVWQDLGISPERSPALGFTESSSLSSLKTSKATLTKNGRYPRTAGI